MTPLAQMLWATGQAVAERELWVRGQCERLEEVSRELDCVKGLAWSTRTTSVQGEVIWACGWAAAEGRC